MQLFSGSVVLAVLLLLAIEPTDGQQASVTVDVTTPPSSGPDVQNVGAYLSNSTGGGQITAVLVTSGQSQVESQNIAVVVNPVGDSQHLFPYTAWGWIMPVMDSITVERKSTGEFDLLALTAETDKQQGLVSHGELDFYVMHNSTPLDVLSFYRLDQFTGEAADKIEKMKPNEKTVRRKSGHLCLQFDVNANPADVPPVCVNTDEQVKTQLLAGFYSPNNVLVLFFFGSEKQVRVYSHPIANKNRPDEVYNYEQFFAHKHKRDSPWDWMLENWIICLLIAIIAIIAIVSSCALCCVCCCCRRRKRTKKGKTKFVFASGKISSKSKKHSRLSSTASGTGPSSTGLSSTLATTTRI